VTIDLGPERRTYFLALTDTEKRIQARVFEKDGSEA
jgi:hypothetical protein